MYDDIDEDCHKIVNSFSSNYIEYEINGDKDKYLNNLIDSHKSQDEQKIKLNGNQVFFL